MRRAHQQLQWIRTPRQARTHERLRERSSRLTRHVVRGLSERLLERRSEIRHPNPELAVSFALLQSMALLVQHYTVAMREIEIVPLSDERVARELASSCLAYLGVCAAAGRNRSLRPLGVRDPHAAFEGGSQ